MGIHRVFLIVFDGVGIGALPDAARFGDQDSNTLVNTARAVTGLSVPFLQSMGIGNLAPIAGVPPARRATGAYGVMGEASAGKDTLTGHFEMTQLVVASPFPVFPGGFPADLIRRFEDAIGRRTLGNKPASGTVIIEELGPEHLATGYPIVYTSADSVFQVAAHTDVVPLEELYGFCRTARSLLRGEYAVARVIARPFTGRPGSFKRTSERRDFGLEPPGPSSLDRLAGSGKRVWGIGKIEDIFSGRGLTDRRHTTNNAETLAFLLELVKRDFSGLVFANCGDFDTLYGHRNDPVGFARALSEADRSLAELFVLLKKEDLLIVTADHGCDPTTASTDHSREYVPLIVAGLQVRPGPLGTRSTFADVGATVEELLLGESPGPGTSFARQIL